MAFSIDYPAPARRAFSGSLISASVAFGTACGGQTSSAAPRVDGGIDASMGGVEAGQQLDAATDARKMNPVIVPDAACVPGELGSACVSPETGCPSVQVCEYDGSGFDCPCEECDFELSSTDCAWTVQGDYLGYRFQSGFQSGAWVVSVVSPDGGRSRVPEVETEEACGNSPGWYAEGTQVEIDVYTTLTFRLCPASCSEHQGDARMSFLLGSHGCPFR